jgi:hypothetical protein
MYEPSERVVCPACEGTGTHRFRPYCLACAGTGRVSLVMAAAIRERQADPSAYSRKISAGIQARRRTCMQQPRQ